MINGEKLGDGSNDEPKVTGFESGIPPFSGNTQESDSTDNSADIVQQFSNKDPRIKLVQKANGGTASARKLGLEHATGEYIQFLDADDSIDTDKLSIQVRFMQQHSLDVSYTDWCMIDTNGKKVNSKM